MSLTSYSTDLLLVEKKAQVKVEAE